MIGLKSGVFLGSDMKTKDTLIGLGISLLAAGLSFFAASSPDGLMRVAQDKNFIGKACSVIKSPIPDYLVPGINNGKLSALAAALAGVILAYLLGFGLARIIKRH